MNNLDILLPMLILGMIILDISFFCQIWNIWTKKHSYGLSLSSWIINFTGRIIWVIYGALLGTKGGLALTIGQGLCGLMGIPIIYYILRNRKTDGEYVQEHFKKRLFALRVAVVTFVTVLIIACAVFGSFTIQGKYNHPNNTTTMVVSLIGSSFTGLSFLPQSINTFRTKDTKSTSLALCIAFIIGNIMMISYLLVGVIAIDVFKYIPGVIFTSISVASMLVITMIKLNNIKKAKNIAI